MINGKIVDLGTARSRDYVDVSITVRLPRVRTEEWPALRAALQSELAKGGTATVTAMCEAVEEAAPQEVSAALVRHLERSADSDDGESVEVEMSDTDSDGWDYESDDDSDGRDEDE